MANTINETTFSKSILSDTTDIAFRTTSQLGIDQVMTHKYIPEKYAFDTTPFTGRYFFVKSVAWTDADVGGNYILKNFDLPRDVFAANTSLKNLLSSVGYYRMKLTMSIALAGTIVHGGCLLVSAIPPATTNFYSGILPTNTLLTCPHAFLYACEATSVELSIPWYCNTDYAPIAFDTHPDFNLPAQAYASLAIFVINPLRSGGGSSSLNLTISARFDELELMVPVPHSTVWVPYSLTDMRSETIIGDLASGITSMANAGKKITGMVGDIFDRASKISSMFTGLHNPNVPVIQQRVITSDVNFLNTVDSQQAFEKLDPYVSAERTTNEFLFGTTEDEMSLRYIAAKEQYLGTISVSTSMVVGKVLWSRPISPFQTYTYTFANNISLLYYMSRGWSGDFEIVIRSAGTAKQQVKLLVTRMYSPDKRVETYVPEMASSVNALSQLLEFSQGGQEHVVLMPFLSPLEVLPCTLDSSTMACMHGMYYIYVAQPLVVGDNSPTTMDINIFIRSKNLKFYGYGLNSPVDAVTAASMAPTPVSEKRTSRRPSTPMRSESGLQFMNQPQPQDGAPVDESRHGVSDRIHPIDHLRDIVRRMYYTGIYAIGPSTTPKEVVIPVDALIGADYPGTIQNLQTNPLIMSLAMFYGRQIGFKLRVVLISESDMGDVEFLYLPPQPILGRTGATTSQYYACKPYPTKISTHPLCRSESFVTNGQTYKKLTYECVIPNVSLAKFNNVNMSGTYHQVSDNFYTQKYGDLIISGVFPANTNALLYVGLTDESRVGFHCMAPAVQYGLIQSPTSYQIVSPYLTQTGSQIDISKTNTPAIFIG